MQGSRAGNILVYRSGTEGQAGSMKPGAEICEKTPVGSLLTWRALASSELFCLCLEGILQSLQDCPI